MKKLRNAIKSFHEETEAYEGLNFNVFRQLNSKYGDTFQDPMDDGRVYYVQLINVPKEKSLELGLTPTKNIVLVSYEEIFEKSIIIEGQLM